MLRNYTCIVLIALITGGAHAQNTVYRTVNEDGVVTFSDQPPDTDVPVETLTIDTPATQPTDDYSHNLEAMRETTDRMVEDRRAREKHRAEMRELAARTAEPKQPEHRQPDESDYSPATYSRSYRREYRPPWYWQGHRPRPQPPIARPPLRPRPLPSGALENNAQLMRPIVSDNASTRGWTR